jgi:hypothetical protein
VKIRIFLAALLAMGLVACGNDDAVEPSLSADSYTGIVTAVESEGLNEVTSFDLKSDDETVTILIDRAMNYGFPLGHLEEHRVTAEPVEVDVEERDGKLYARSIEDAQE